MMLSISSLLVLRAASKVRSTTETLIVGTRIANPSSLPLSSGSTRPTAAAAPVLVGIMDMVPNVHDADPSVDVGQHLIIRVGMDGRHQAVLDTDPVVQGLDQRRQAMVVHDALEITVSVDFRVS